MRSKLFEEIRAKTSLADLSGFCSATEKTRFASVAYRFNLLSVVPIIRAFCFRSVQVESGFCSASDGRVSRA